MPLWIPAGLILVAAGVLLATGAGWAWPLLIVGVVGMIAAGLVGGAS